jgi:hypothetical protein
MANTRSLSENKLLTSYTKPLVTKPKPKKLQTPNYRTPRPQARLVYEQMNI